MIKRQDRSTNEYVHTDRTIRGKTVSSQEKGDDVVERQTSGRTTTLLYSTLTMALRTLPKLPVLHDNTD